MKKKIKEVYAALHPKKQVLTLDYPVDMHPRYGFGKPAHPALSEIIKRDQANYTLYLLAAQKYFEILGKIKPLSKQNNSDLPAWNNGFLPGLDMLMLFTFLAEHKPKNYIEVGSGNSTKMARYAIEQLGLKTKITSIDPFPRAEIDHLSDEIIRKPFEQLDNYEVLLGLQDNDILFIDNSHRVLPNSDANVFFLEILPFLKSGVVVQIHDVYLPFDYPQFMCDRFYSEQYMLAMALLMNPQRFSILAPNYFISENEQLSDMLEKFWVSPNLNGVEKHGGSFWFQFQ